MGASAEASQRGLHYINIMEDCFTIIMSIQCGSDGSCPFLYQCGANNSCAHIGVFAPSAYQIAIYCLFPFASAICNLSGNSFGEYKVLLLMDLLNYSASEATVLTYPLTAGTALFNFLSLIPKRHLTQPTSLVDYNIVLILIPNILYGSTCGAIVNDMIPPIVSDSLIMILLAAFCAKFFLRFLSYRKVGELSNLKEIMSPELQIQYESVNRQAFSVNMNQRQSNDDPYKDAASLADNNGYDGHSAIAAASKIGDQNPPPTSQELTEILEYEAGFHVPHILATLLIFGVFEALSFLVQGKIVKFSICSTDYVIGISVLSAIYLGFILAGYRYTCHKLKKYRRAGYKYKHRLDKKRKYALLCLSGFIGGFNGGVFGMGSSTTMIFMLLYIGIEPAVVSASVGFQVVFGGLANLCQAFVLDSITGAVAGLMVGITFVLGGLLSYVGRRILSGCSENKVNQVLMMIVCVLTGSSVLALIVNISLGYVIFGAAYMTSIKFSCS